MLHANFKVFIRCAVPPVEVYHHSLKTRFLSRINRWLYKGCDLMIAQTEFMRQDLIRAYHMRPDQVRVIRNIIDKAYIDRSIASEEIICLPNGFNFVASGMLYSVKGFDLLIEAIAPIVKRHRNVFLSILGEERYETGYRDFLQSKIDALGIAVFPILCRGVVAYQQNTVRQIVRVGSAEVVPGVIVGVDHKLVVEFTPIGFFLAGCQRQCCQQ